MLSIYNLVIKNPRTLANSRPHGLFRATDGARTRGLDLGKVARYQLRHCRMYLFFLSTYYIIAARVEFVNNFFNFFNIFLIRIV